MKWVLDTSALSALMRRESHVMRLAAACRPGDLVLCSPVAAEIHFGLERLVAGSKRRLLLRSELERWRSALPWADWDEGAARQFGIQKAALERAGTPVADMDVVIGSIALDLGIGVATRNPRDFVKLKGLQVASWLA